LKQKLYPGAPDDFPDQETDSAGQLAAEPLRRNGEMAFEMPKHTLYNGIKSRRRLCDRDDGLLRRVATMKETDLQIS